MTLKRFQGVASIVTQAVAAIVIETRWCALCVIYHLSYKWESDVNTVDRGGDVTDPYVAAATAYLCHNLLAFVSMDSV